jgi:hypothetical protein
MQRVPPDAHSSNLGVGNVLNICVGTEENHLARSSNILPANSRPVWGLWGFGKISLEPVLLLLYGLIVSETSEDAECRRDARWQKVRLISHHAPISPPSNFPVNQFLRAYHLMATELHWTCSDLRRWVRNDSYSWECPRFLIKPETHFHVICNILMEACRGRGETSFLERGRGQKIWLRTHIPTVFKLFLLIVLQLPGYMKAYS